MVTSGEGFHIPKKKKNGHLGGEVVQLPILQTPKHVLSPVALDSTVIVVKTGYGHRSSWASFL